MTIKPVRRKAAATKAAVKTQPEAASPVRRGLPPIPRPPEVHPVAVHGLFVDTASVIPRTAATLHMMPGRLEADEGEERAKVLVPFAEVRLGGGPITEVGHGAGGDEDDKDLPTIFAQSLPLENLAFVLLDLTSDLKRICTEITDLAKGDLTVDPARMAVVRYFVAHLERQARQCRVRLDSTYDVPEVTETE